MAFKHKDIGIDLTKNEWEAADTHEGVLNISRGGTGLSTIALGGILYASVLDVLSRIAPTAANQVLRSTAANALVFGALVADDIPILTTAKLSDVPASAWATIFSTTFPITTVLSDHTLAQHHELFLGIDSNGKLVLTQIGTKVTDLATLWTKGIKIDHGGDITGLDDDDHPQYRIKRKGYVTICLDDAYVSQYTYRTEFSTRNIEPVLGVITQLVGSTYEGRNVMSWANIATLAGLGWEIAAHSQTHPHNGSEGGPFRVLSDANMEDEIKDCLTDLEGQGYSPITWLQPGGNYPQNVSPRIFAYILKHYKISRLIRHGDGTNYRDILSSQTHAHGVVSIVIDDVRIAERGWGWYDAVIAAAEYNDAWIVFYTHAIEEVSETISQANLQTFLNKIVASNLEVVTFKEAWDKFLRHASERVVPDIGSLMYLENDGYITIDSDYVMRYKWIQHLLGGGCGGSVLDAGYASIQGAQVVQDNPDKCYMVLPFAGTLKDLYCRLTSVPGVGNSWTFTVWKPWEDTALTCTISDANADGEDTTHDVSFARGDRICMHITKTGTPEAAFGSWGAIFEVA